MYRVFEHGQVILSGFQCMYANCQLSNNKYVSKPKNSTEAIYE